MSDAGSNGLDIFGHLMATLKHSRRDGQKNRHPFNAIFKLLIHHEMQSWSWKSLSHHHIRKNLYIIRQKKKKKAPITGPTFPVEPGKRQHPDKLEFTLSGWGSATARIHSSSNQGVEEGMPLLPNRQIFLFPDLGSIGLEVFVLKEGILLPDNTAMVSLNWQVRQPLGHFVLGMPQNQKAKRVVTVLAGVSNPDFQGEIGLFS